MGHFFYLEIRRWFYLNPLALKNLRCLARLEGKPAPTTGLGRVRAWAAWGMVIVSIAPAAAVVRASVFDDDASHEDGLYRQQLLAREGAARLNGTPAASATGASSAAGDLRSTNRTSNPTPFHGVEPVAGALRTEVDRRADRLCCILLRTAAPANPRRRTTRRCRDRPPPSPVSARTA